MTKKYFESLVSKLKEDCDKIQEEKHSDYCKGDDVLYALYEGARRVRISTLENWHVLFVKQFLAIEHFIARGYLNGEDIRSRICDCINFLHLLAALIDKEENKDFEDPNIISPVEPDSGRGLFDKLFSQER